MKDDNTAVTPGEDEVKVGGPEPGGARHDGRVDEDICVDAGECEERGSISFGCSSRGGVSY